MEKKEIKLNRESCEKCLNLKAKKTTNSLGRQMYCSQGHAYELFNIQKAQSTGNLKKEIFTMIYDWGRIGLVVDENAPAIKEKLDKLEDTWY